ncbi:hypothetical protein OPV22_007863 [Ensete ventricosum]|uniref:Uncharacterized protein n=1 Tax=Ensete ventricosum TaxID=4639 RepID=A0AAV8R5B8_ENSVE|nr:hypothetical protein OPV22_007863 [Ensete ventricosum]
MPTLGLGSMTPYGNPWPLTLSLDNMLFGRPLWSHFMWEGWPIQDSPLVPKVIEWGRKDEIGNGCCISKVSSCMHYLYVICLTTQFMMLPSLLFLEAFSHVSSSDPCRVVVDMDKPLGLLSSNSQQYYYGTVLHGLSTSS